MAYCKVSDRMFGGVTIYDISGRLEANHQSGLKLDSIKYLRDLCFKELGYSHSLGLSKRSVDSLWELLSSYRKADRNVLYRSVHKTLGEMKSGALDEKKSFEKQAVQLGEEDKKVKEGLIVRVDDKYIIGKLMELGYTREKAGEIYGIVAEYNMEIDRAAYNRGYSHGYADARGGR